MLQQMAARLDIEVRHRYSDRTVLLTTKHEKAAALALPLRAGVGLRVEAIELDTDKLGTFTGEVERLGTPLETAVRKARLGMTLTSSSLGLASEGSFGPHPFIPFIAGCQEIVALVDDELGYQISETIISSKTNFGHCSVQSIEEADEFLLKAKFPSHGVIVRPNKFDRGVLKDFGRMISGKSAIEVIVKGIRDRSGLRSAIESCKKISDDGRALIETDMRAHMNPTRMRVLRELGVKLARRLRSICTECGCPGFGITSVQGFLDCSECGYASESPSHEVHSCPRCNYCKTLPRSDGMKHVDPMYCQRCNP